MDKNANRDAVVAILFELGSLPEGGTLSRKFLRHVTTANSSLNKGEANWVIQTLINLGVIEEAVVYGPKHRRLSLAQEIVHEIQRDGFGTDNAK